MNEHTYKKIEVVGTSEVSIEAAVNNAIAASEKTVRNLRWFEVDEVRGNIKGGQVNEWQVGIKLAFTIENDNEVSIPLQDMESSQEGNRHGGSADKPVA